jgi:hypothetical protein
LAQFLRGIAIEIKQQSRLVMTHTSIPETPGPLSALQGSQNVDQTRRKLASAGLGGSAVLITLASRPVLGATCLTPSAAGSGNHSQHHPVVCSPQSPQYWIDNVPTKMNANNKEVVDVDTVWPGTAYKPGDAFHPTFTATSTFEYTQGGGTQGSSYSLYEVLTGQKLSGGSINNFTDLNNIGPWFVAGLLNASAGLYGGVIQAIGPDPSVRGIEDEYARLGHFVPTVGKTWYFDTIIAYLGNPGSVF